MNSTQVEPFAAPALTPSGAGRLQTRLGPLTDESALELGQGAKDVEDQPPAPGIRVDRFLQALQPHTLVAQHFGAGDEVLERTNQPVEPPDHQRIAGAKMRERVPQARTFGGTALGIFENSLAPSRLVTESLPRCEKRLRCP